MLASTKVLDALKGIGLNLYERKLWVALLARGTSTAGELSEIANVPRSRAYDVLQSLAEKGFVIVQTGKPIRYVAIAPEEALERAKKKLEEDFKIMQQRIDELKESPLMRELNDIFSQGLKLVAPEEITGALKGKFSVFQQLDSMFKVANQKINIATTPEGLNDLFANHLDVLRKAKEKGVEIKIITSGTEKCSEAIKAFSSIADIRVSDEREIPLEGRFAIVDGKQLVFSLTDSKSVHATQDIAVWSKSEHAASNVLEPLFKLVWNHSKAVS
ncbi:MAG: helix-turn-helix domain-containing protein [Candidatus Aenigmarchaeota archaeon]|nr:helix-turn-helix domain-containing protein [Candidatus Aenigmarchaeota archaeon]